MRIQTSEPGGGRWTTDVHCELGELDGYWFPTKVEFHTRAYRDGRDPVATYKVKHAEFNRPEHPKYFTTEDIGIAKGSPVVFCDRNGTEKDYGVCNGLRFATPAEFAAQQAAEQAAAREPSQTGVAGWSRRESDWEAYTRRFIERYRLNEDQAQRAWRILRDCQRRREEYLGRTKEQIAAVESEIETARRDSAAPPTRLAELEQRLARLLAPVDEIFRTRLVPRLETLPTAAQRRAAAGQ